MSSQKGYEGNLNQVGTLCILRNQGILAIISDQTFNKVREFEGKKQYCILQEKYKPTDKKDNLLIVQ